MINNDGLSFNRENKVLGMGTPPISNMKVGSGRTLAGKFLNIIQSGHVNNTFLFHGTGLSNLVNSGVFKKIMKLEPDIEKFGVLNGASIKDNLRAQDRVRTNRFPAIQENLRKSLSDSDMSELGELTEEDYQLIDAYLQEISIEREDEDAIDVDDEVNDQEMEAARAALGEAEEPTTPYKTARGVAFASLGSISALASQMGKFLPQTKKEVERFQIALAELGGELFKTNVRYAIGSREITAENAKDLFAFWVTLKIKHPTEINNLLAYTTEWMNAIRDGKSGELLDLVYRDISGGVDADTFLAQWQFKGTMHRVYDFAVKYPKVCVEVTKLLDQCKNSLMPFDDLPSKEKSALADKTDQEKAQRELEVTEFQHTVENFVTTVRNNPEIFGGANALANMMIHSNSGAITKMIVEFQSHSTFLFKAMESTTNFFQAVEHSPEAKEAIQLIFTRVAKSIVSLPEEKLGKITGQVANAIEHPAVLPIISQLTNEVNKIITANPQHAVLVANALLFAIEHPRMASGLAKTASALLPSSDENNAENNNLLTVLGGLSEAVVQVLDPIKEITPIFGKALPPEMKAHTPNEPQGIIEAITTKTKQVAGQALERSLDTGRRIGVEAGTGVLRRAGELIVSTSLDAGTSLVQGNISSTSLLQASKEFSVTNLSNMAWQELKNISQSAAKVVLWETFNRTVIAPLIKEHAPILGENGLSLETVSVIYNIGNALISPNCKQELLSVAMRVVANQAVQNLSGGITEKVQIDNPLLAPILQGAVSALSTKIVSLTTDKFQEKVQD